MSGSQVIGARLLMLAPTALRDQGLQCPTRIPLKAIIMHYRFSFLSFFLLCVSSARADSLPNVLFLAVDDMNDWIGCLETTPRAITPNLDRLVARGVNFTNAHTAGVFCAPSRAAIFSGQYASTTGCYRTATYFVDHPEIESLQTSFSKAGYETYGEIGRASCRERV